MREHSRRALTPPGISLSGEARFFAAGLICAVLYSLRFVLAYVNARGELFETNRLTRERVLIDGAVMPDFSEVLDGALLGFAVLAFCMLFAAVYHYQTHFHGSRSIYLMCRLPDRWELHRRCLAVPVLGGLSCAVVSFLLLLIYFAVYQLATPQECLTPHQWQKLWSVII